jgi:hypothetical protein
LGLPEHIYVVCEALKRLWRDAHPATVGCLTWLAELDWFRQDPADAGHTTGLVTSHEFSLLARQGLEVLATYDFRDPDWNFQTGSSSRYGGGVSVMPRPFLVAQALLRATRYTRGADVNEDDYWETVLQLHLLY